VDKKNLKNKELFSAVTHEIRNSLNPVINLSSILLRNTSDRLTADENSYLEVIERNGKKILNLVEEFSFLNKLPDSPALSGKEKKHQLSSVSVSEMIDNAFIGMMALSSCSGCKLKCDVDDKSSVFNTDKEVFRRILENTCLFFLSLNGDNPTIYFRAAMSGSKFHLNVSRKKTELIMNDQTVFDKNRIIEKGYSASSVMWLHFASLYVYHLKGEMHFSHDGEGDAAFSFSIPAGSGESENPEAVHAGDDAASYGANREFVMLVIDDDIDNIIPVNAIIEHEFKGKGTVYHAESGGKGLDLLEKIKPDIILLDLTLPDISGLSLVRNIKHLFVKKNIPVIAFSGLDVAGDTEKMLKSGFDDVIRKPFNIDTFVKKIRKWIN
jgi:CheY-like chemotaxis protein